MQVVLLRNTDHPKRFTYIVLPQMQLNGCEQNTEPCVCLPECCALGWLGVRGEIAGVSGVMAAVGFWGGVRWSGFAVGAGGAASLSGF